MVYLFACFSGKKQNYMIKKYLLILTAFLCFVVSGFGQMTDLIISEYVEGSSSNKYIEIYNGTGSNVNLSDYQILLFSNGNSAPNNTNTLSGILADGAVVVYSNSSASIYTGTTTNLSAIGFNGDDAIALYKISTTSYVDIFGRIGNDPGSSWTSGSHNTINKTLVRKPSVCGGVTVSPTGTGSGAFTTLSSEWDVFNQNDISNLGSHTESCSTSDPDLSITGITDHGSVCEMTLAATITYTITNNGTLPAAGITVVSDNTEFVVSNLSSTSIAASGTATYDVTFTPSSTGNLTATITVSSTTVTSNSPTIDLNGTGTTLPTLTEPLDANVVIPAPATFTVTPSDASSFQWEVNTGSGWGNAPGATQTTATYDTGTTDASMDGNQYRCIVTNACGFTNTNAATLNLSSSIPNNALNLTSCIGENNISLNWNNASGGATGYLVFAQPNSTIPFMAATSAGNADDYFADSNYSTAISYSTLGKAVYKGNLNSAIITGLTNGLNYTFKVIAYNGDTLTGWANGISNTNSSSSYIQTYTIGMQNATFTNASIAPTSSVINWTNPLPTACYEIIIVANQGAVTFTPTGNGSAYTPNTVYSSANQVVYKGNGNVATVTNLTDGQLYCYSAFVRNIATNEWSSGDTICQTTGLSYCTSSGGSTTSGILNVNLNTINNPSASSNAYTDFTSISTNLTLGEQYSLSVNVNTGGNYTSSVKVWIDWNRDGSFNDSSNEAFELGTLVNNSNGSPSLSPVNITVPSNAVIGNVRMRVSAKSDNGEGYATPCEESSFSYGEVEDYTINIIQPINQEILVKGANISIIGNGTNIPFPLDNTLFGSRAIIAGSQNKIFTINNIGAQDLNISSIVFGGSHPGDFMVSGSPPATTINPGNSENLQITFSPLAVGVRTATIEISSNDPDENPFIFNIQGTGTCNNATYTLSPASGPAGAIVTVTATMGANPNSSTALYDGNTTTVTNLSPGSFEITIPINAISSNITFDDANGCLRSIPFIVIDKENSNCQGTNIAPTQIFISEVTDRDSSIDGHSYIELFNGTGADINISNYELEVHRNGSSSVSYINIPNGAIIANNDVYVISFGTGSTVVDPVGENDYFSNTIGINDRDHIILNNGSSDIDLWGDTSGNTFTVGTGSEYNSNPPVPNGSDYTYRRKNTVSVPSLTWNPSEWDALSPVNYSDIGNYNFSAGTAPDVTTQPTPQVSTCDLTASFTVEGQETFTGFGDSQDITYQWYYSAPGDLGWNVVPNTAPYVIGTNTEANLDISNTINLDGYQYYCQIREDDEFCFKASNAVRLHIEKAIWTSSGWSSTPTLGKVVIIDDDYDTSDGTNGQTSFEACNLIINPDKTLLVKSNDYVSVNYNVTNNGTFIIENNGSLVQIDDTGVNTGNINMERKASVDNLDYVYWSSPVSNFDVNNISTTQYIYKWNPTFNNTNGTQGNWIPDNGNMEKGVGYIVRGYGSQAAPINPGDLNFTVDFVGVPFNGLIPVAVSRGIDKDSVDDNWNLIGNPYPSAVDVFLFLDHLPNKNVLDGFVHFWTHGNDPIYAPDPFYYDFGSNYTATDYIAYNAVGAGNGPGNISIAAGQSFMVNMLNGTNSTDDSASTNIEFNNSMRNKAFDNSQFYRTTETNYHTAEKHRIWLDLVSEAYGTNRILVGYVEGATMEHDRMYDAITSVSSNQSLYSIIDETPFIIQGRSLPFNDTDAIPLGVNIVEQGNYHIAIAYIDGLFETDSQIIYLKDNALGFIHNLNEAPYSFASATGNFNDRFELVFRDSFLSINEEELTSNNLTIIEHNNGQVQFIVPNQYEIKKIEIIDLLGRTIYNLNGNSYSETYNLSNLSQATYIAKITLSNGQVISKKGMKRK